MGARFYNQGTGRFTQRDPIGYKGGLNLYSYAFNNPLYFIDPFGLAFMSDARCAELFRKIQALTKDVELHIDYVEHPLYPNSDLHYGHIKELKQKQSGLKDLMNTYNKQCKCRDPKRMGIDGNLKESVEKSANTALDYNFGLFEPILFPFFPTLDPLLVPVPMPVFPSIPVIPPIPIPLPI
jgi:hypothetical protein